MLWNEKYLRARKKTQLEETKEEYKFYKKWKI